MRAIFTGAISFGLVLIPIRIYAATEDRQIEFHMLCNVCNTPLGYKRWCPKCENEVKWQDVKKGYKITKEKWVILEKDDIEKIKPKTTKAIEILEFVDVSQIDPIFYEKSYYVVPEPQATKAYSLFAEALRLTNKAAVGKVVMREKEYVVVLRPFQKGLAMHILHYLNEIRNINELPEVKELPEPKKEELELAKTLVQRLTEEEFNAKKFRDDYTEALTELIKSKAEGKVFEVKVEEEVARAKNLMEALKISVKAVKKKKK